ncbi:MAG TPA: hypothetical protein ENJ93_04150 [Chloroflexi bacterium]|nr:hypothetical protein [Chloroflexota bacterium]
MNDSPDSYRSIDPDTPSATNLKKGNRPVLWLACGIVTAVLLFIFLCAAFIFGIIAVTFGSMKSSAPYQQALSAAQTNPQAVQALGEPIKAGFLLSGSINLSGNTGDASLAIPVSGPKGKGTIYVEAEKYDNAWHYSRLELQVDGRPAPIPLNAEN